MSQGLRSVGWGAVGVLACVSGLSSLSGQGRVGGAKRAEPTLGELRAGFVQPPPAARLRCYWWWLNGNTDEATITNDLEQMKAKGFGGALLVDANGANQLGNREVPAGPTFASAAWVKLYTHALKEADRLGLEITLNITSGWNLGGPEVTPEQASKVLTWTRTQMKGGAATHTKLADAAVKNGYYRQIAVLAYPLQHGAGLAAQPDDRQGDRHTGEGQGSGRSQEMRSVEMRSAATLRFRSAAAESGFSMPDSAAMLRAGEDVGFADTPLSGVRDVTAQVSAEGVLQWEAPAGEWEVLRIGYTDSDAKVSTASGAWQGLAIDYMSREAFDQYWQKTVEPLLVASKPFHSLKYLATDSWELGGTNWTAKFRDEFQRLRGYDPLPWLPVVAGRIVGDREQSTRFLTDLRRTVADLIVSEHYDVFAAKAREHGLGTQSESGGPHGAPIDALATFRRAGVVQTEFWSENAHRSTDVERFFTKEASSAAHIYGQRFIAQEGETSIGPQWSESLSTDLKPSFDMAITEGMNRLVWHEFTSSPAATGLPGQEYFAGTHLNPKVTWWNAGGAFFTYLNRVQYLMQEGTQVNDLLYFYGDHVPNFVRLKADDPAHVLPGYDYDVTNEDALLHSIKSVAGKLTGPDGVAWKALALPKTRRVSMEVLRWVEAYVRAGGVVVGLAPESVTGLETAEAHAQFKGMVDKVWGEACVEGSSHGYGKGKVFCTQDGRAALAGMQVLPDVEIAGGGGMQATSTGELDYVHRRIGDADVYFVRNGSARASQHEVVFRVSGRRAELWDAVTGEMGAVRGSTARADGRVQVPVELAPFGSAVVVFRAGLAEKAVGAGVARVAAVTRRAPWTIGFQEGRGGPVSPLVTTELTSWAESPDAAVKYFSGSATYKTMVAAPEHRPGEKVWLQFADVREVARVKVNGTEAGSVWAIPLRVRVDRLLKRGENRLEIEVTNLWPNRIIGDLQPGVRTRITATNITTYRADSPLLPSGLIGPVEWVIEP